MKNDNRYKTGNPRVPVPVPMVLLTVFTLLFAALTLSGCDGETVSGGGTDYGGDIAPENGFVSDTTGIYSDESGAYAGQTDPYPDESGAYAGGTDTAAGESDAYPEENFSDYVLDLSDVPPFDGSAAYVSLNGGVPGFSPYDLTTESFETYSELDELGRCGVAYANVGTDLMPTQARGSISQVKPTGWDSAQYDIVDGKYLYNRCHLIGYQLTAENANRQNLITGTRYLNVRGMLPFENLVADYVQETDNHVLYRVTPVFIGDNLVADGVQIEAISVEDAGESVLFNVYCYNVQPGIVIDYATGASALADTSADVSDSGNLYILNTRTKKFHLPDCSNAARMNADVREEYTGSRDALIAEGYDPCQICKP